MKRILFFMLSFLLVSVLSLQNGIAQDLPEAALVRFGDSTTIYENTERPDAILSVSFSADNKTLVSGSEQGFIRFWNVEKKRLERTLTGVGYYVKVAHSPDGKTLVGAGEWDGQNEGSIKLWDSNTKQLIHDFSLGPEPWTYIPHSYSSISFSPDGKSIVAGLIKAEKALGIGHPVVWVWDILTGDFKLEVGKHRFNDPPGAIWCVSYSPDGRKIVVGDKIYDSVSGGWERTLRIPVGIGVIEFSPDGETLAIATLSGHGALSGMLKLWNFRGGAPEVDLVGHGYPIGNPQILDLEYSPDGKTLASASEKVIRLYDIETLKERQILEGHTHGVTSISYSPDGNLLASGSWDGTILVWDSINEFEEEEEEIPEPPNRAEDVNLDGVVDISDLVLVAKQFGRKLSQFGENRADVNGDMVVDIVDLQLVAEAFADVPSAPFATLQGLDVLEQLLASLTAAEAIPAKTTLLPNYPNPFNPETWIPYHLARDADVTLTIYDTQGVLVRRLDLGHQRAGFYTERAKAVHWDGRNEMRELVASGVYTYQFRAGDYVALRRMVILK